MAPGLWGHAGLAHAPPKPLILTLIALTFLGYSCAMLVNTAATRFVPPRFALAPRARGVDPLAGLGLVVRVLDPLFLIGLMRALCAAALFCALLVGKRVPAPPSLASPQLARAVAAGFFNASGYATYLALVARGSASTWAALVGLYVVGPVCYGLFARGEARTPRKLAGVAVCVVAGVVLSLSESEADDTGVSGWADAALFVATIGQWTVCDSIASFIGRDLDVAYVAVASGAGFALAAFFAATASYFSVSGAAVAAEGRGAGGAGGAAAGGLSPGAGLALLFFAQACGIGAWFSVVILGRLSEASAFIPITSLYTVFASILSAFVFGETPSKFYWVGLPLATIGISLIAFGGEGDAVAETVAAHGVELKDAADGSAEQA
jgi:drug/metabolite transporter (DMT)-like permease